MASASKNKGNRFEYAIRDALNKAFNTKEFARTPGSGAIMGRSNFAKRAGLSEAAKDTLSADLICPEWFPYSIEAKNYADKPNLHAVLQGYDSTLDGWVGESLFDAGNFGKIPLLFFNTTRKGSYVVAPKLIAEHLTLSHYCVYRDFYIVPMSCFIENAIIVRDKGKELLPDVLNWMETSSHVKELLLIGDVKATVKRKPKKKKGDEDAIV